MPDEPIQLSDAEREFLARSGMSAERHAAIRDAPRQVGGGRSVPDLLAAIDATTKESDR